MNTISNGISGGNDLGVGKELVDESLELLFESVLGESTETEEVDNNSSERVDNVHKALQEKGYDFNERQVADLIAVAQSSADGQGRINVSDLLARLSGAGINGDMKSVLSLVLTTVMSELTDK